MAQVAQNMPEISLIAHYEEKLAAGVLRPDAAQRAAITLLQDLSVQLSQPARAKAGWRAWFSGARAERAAGRINGVYFYGDVGRGKTMAMDLFFDTVPVAQKRRVHFHAFMLEVHDFLHRRRAARRAQGAVAETGVDDDLMACADDIADTARLLCFDEFFVKDVADAMILGRLFTALFARGVVVVMTSNTAPENLYPDGLQRDRFLPFIALLKEKMHILSFTGATDYRLGRMRDARVYYWPHDVAAQKEMREIFMAVTDGAQALPQSLRVKGRVVHVPEAAGTAAWFHFNDLCVDDKSAVDYLELVRVYHVFFIEDVPFFDDARRDILTRFVTLVDTLYDNRARVVISAAAAPEALYTGALYQGVFARTASRLTEMQSRDYREK